MTWHKFVHCKQVLKASVETNIFLCTKTINSHSTVKKNGYKEYPLTMSSVPPMLSNAYNDGKEIAGCEQVHIVTEQFNIIFL